MWKVLASLGLAGVLLVGLSGTAYAADDPPAEATAAPGMSVQPAPGDSRNYWASDQCHYYTQGGQWLSDLCARPVDSSNQVLGWFQNTGDGGLGRELIRFDMTNPAYFTIGTIDQNTYSVSMWMRAPMNDLTKMETLGRTIDGQPIWVPVPTQTQMQTGNSDSRGSGGVGPNSNANYDPVRGQLMQDIIKTQGEMAMNTLLPCRQSINGC